MNKESILLSIKKLLGIPEEVMDFDDDLIIHINTIFSILIQMGIGPENGYVITDDKNAWGEFETNINQISMIKTYICLRVRMTFDPPTNGTLTQSIENQIKELEYRLSTIRELDKTVKNIMEVTNAIQ